MDVSSSDDDLPIASEHLQALKRELGYIAALPPISDEVLLASIVKYVIGIVHTCPIDDVIERWGNSTLKVSKQAYGRSVSPFLMPRTPPPPRLASFALSSQRWLRTVEKSSALDGPRPNSLAFPLIQLVRRSFKATGGGGKGKNSMKKKRLRLRFKKEVFDPVPRGAVELEIAQLVALLGVVEGIWEMEHVRDVLEKTLGEGQRDTAASLATKAEIYSVAAASSGDDADMRATFLGKYAACLTSSAEMLVEANAKSSSLAAALSEPEGDYEDAESLAFSVAIVSGHAMPFLTGPERVDFCSVATSLAAPLLLALKGVLRVRRSGVVTVLRALKLLVAGCVEQLRGVSVTEIEARPEGGAGDSGDANANDISFDEYGGMDFGEVRRCQYCAFYLRDSLFAYTVFSAQVNLELVEAQHSLSSNKALSELRDAVVVILNEIRPSESYTYSSSSKLVHLDSKTEVNARLDDIGDIYSGLLALPQPQGRDMSWAKDIKEVRSGEFAQRCSLVSNPPYLSQRLLASKDLTSMYQDKEWKSRMERKIFVRLCGYKLKASDDIISGAWSDCLVALVGTLVDYRGLEPFQSEKKAIECHRMARSGSGYDRDSLGVKFKKNEGNGVFKCLWTWMSNFARISTEARAGGGIGLVLKEVLAEMNDDGPEDERRLRGLRGSLEREIWKRRLALCRICDFFVASEVNTPGRLLVVSACVRGLLSNICGFVRGHLVDEVDELLKLKYIGLGVGVLVSAGAEIAVDDAALNPPEEGGGRINKKSLYRMIKDFVSKGLKGGGKGGPQHSR